MAVATAWGPGRAWRSEPIRPWDCARRAGGNARCAKAVAVLVSDRRKPSETPFEPFETEPLQEDERSYDERRRASRVAPPGTWVLTIRTWERPWWGFGLVQRWVETEAWPPPNADFQAVMSVVEFLRAQGAEVRMRQA